MVPAAAVVPAEQNLLCRPTDGRHRRQQPVSSGVPKLPLHRLANLELKVSYTLQQSNVHSAASARPVIPYAPDDTNLSANLSSIRNVTSATTESCQHHLTCGPVLLARVVRHDDETAPVGVLVDVGANLWGVRRFQKRAAVSETAIVEKQLAGNK